MSELCNYCLHLLLKPQEEDFNKTSSKQFQMWRNISRISGSFSSKWGLKVPLMEENFFPRKQSAEETNNVIGFKGHGHAERRVFSVFCTCVFVFVFEWRCVCTWIWMTLCLCVNLNGIVIGFKGHGHAVMHYLRDIVWYTMYTYVCIWVLLCLSDIVLYLNLNDIVLVLKVTRRKLYSAVLERHGGVTSNYLCLVKSRRLNISMRYISRWGCISIYLANYLWYIFILSNLPPWENQGIYLVKSLSNF